MATGLAGLLGAYTPSMMTMPQEPSGLADILQQQAAQPLMQQVPQVTPPKPGAFDKGGSGWNILGIIGDALQGAAGLQGTYGAAVAENNKLETEGRQRLAELLAKAEAAKVQRSQALEDQKSLIDYRSANPGPDTFGRALAGAGIDPNSPEARALYRKRAEMLTNPVQLVPDGMGGQIAVRPNEMGGGLPQGYDPEEWELVPGDAGSNASGGF